MKMTLLLQFKNSYNNISYETISSVKKIKIRRCQSYYNLKSPLVIINEKWMVKINFEKWFLKLTLTAFIVDLDVYGRIWL